MCNSSLNSPLPRKPSGYTAILSQLLHTGAVVFSEDTMGKKPQTIENVLSKLELGANGCFVWTGTKTGEGYGKLTWGSKRRSAHRIIYESLVGPIPKGMFVLHRCDNPACVNPNHLFLGTAQDNSNDMKAKGRQAKGSQACSKLCESQVVEILSHKQAGMSTPSIAQKYGVTTRTVRKIIRGSIWAPLHEKMQL